MLEGSDPLLSWPLEIGIALHGLQRQPVKPGTCFSRALFPYDAFGTSSGNAHQASVCGLGAEVAERLGPHLAKVSSSFGASPEAEPCPPRWMPGVINK